MADTPVFQKELFLDELFENPEAQWVEGLSDDTFQQRHLKDADSIVCETLMTVPGTTDVEAAVALLRGPWDWWKHGNIADFVSHEDGSSDQILSPVWWFITRVGLHIFPPVELSDRKGLRLPLMLTKDFTGPTSMDVYLDEAGDGLVVRGRFHGLEYHVTGIPNGLAEWLHLDAESGTMPEPFPKGTGWVGLHERLAGGAT